MSPVVYAVLDVGGTTIKVGAVRGTDVTTDSAVDARSTAPAPVVLRQLELATSAALDCVRREGGSPPAGLAIAFPGPFDLVHGRPLLVAPGKFANIHGIDLRTHLRSGNSIWASLPIEFVRDSEAVGVGEARHGAGRRHQRVLTIALGTGVGAVLTQDATPVPRVGDIDIESLFLQPTPEGIVDDALSARGLASTLGVAQRELSKALDDPTPFSAQVDLFANRLGDFLASLARLEADVIVIAGGVARSFHLFQEVVAARLDIPVVAAELGANAAMLGAVRLAFPTT
ncbi:MAG: ROK family protein [Ilumatobacter sp.]